jgi:hypothetical protein
LQEYAYIEVTLDSLHIKINEEYADLLPKLSEEEYGSLKSSIKKNGLRFLNKYPIIINNQGVILDGYHRFKACEELGLVSKLDLDIDVNKQNGGSHIDLAWRVEFNRSRWPWSSDERQTLSWKGGDSKIHEILFIVNCNMRQTSRNLNKFQRVELAIKIKSIIEQIVADIAESSTDIKEKKNIYVPLVGQNRGIPTFYIPQGRAMQELGNLVGVGYNTVKKVLSILDNAPEEVQQRVRTNQMSITEAFNQVLEEAIHRLELGKQNSEVI